LSFAMQKVEGSSPFSRFKKAPQRRGFLMVRGGPHRQLGDISSLGSGFVPEPQG
jgi:hypothetical protein